MTQQPLECRDLTKIYGDLPVLRGVSFSVPAGQITALLGPSGCGKTTTLRLIAGFEWPDSGTILLNGQVVAGPNARVPAEDRRVGMVFQEYALFPHLNVAANIGFGLNLPRREKAARVDEMLTLVGLDGLGDRMPHELSGGQQQRIALARALAPRPDILLLDEPFSNLDAALRAQVRSEVRAILKRSGMTGVFVTHDQEEALSMADEVVVILNGRVAQAGDPQQIYHHPASREVAEFVGEANFLTAQAFGDYAATPLGEVPLARAAQGAVEVLIRPEMLRLTHNDDLIDGDSAQVQWREFYGHDQRVGLTLADGTALVARADAAQIFRPGERVAVALTSAAHPFSL